MEICWGLTLCCSFNCTLCMVNAVAVTDKNKEKISAQLEKVGRTLTYASKLNVLEDIATNFKEVKITFSGGDPLLFEKDLEIIGRASTLFGAKNIKLCTTGACINQNNLDFLKGKISGLEFTLDTIYPRLESTRGPEYSKVNLPVIKLVVENGIPVTVSTVLKKDNISKENIDEIYNFVVENKVRKWDLLQFRPAGRGAKQKHLVPYGDKYKKILEYCMTLEKKNGLIIELHHVFYPIMGIKTKEAVCKIGRNLTILADGTVVSCRLAFNQYGRPVDDAFVLGKLPKDTLKSILSSIKLESIKKYPACRADYFMEHMQ